MADLKEELFDIVIGGPGPYGFRLYGGDGDPLIVAKLRARSKAHDAGLREGDVVLGVNGRSCQTISHGIAMTLLESADQSLHLHLYRGSKDKASLLSAYESLQHQLRPISPGTLPPNRSIFSIQPSPAVQPLEEPSTQPPAVQPPPFHAPDAIQEKAAEPEGSYSRQEVTSVGEGVTQTITKETQDLGGVTVTRVTRQVVKEINSDPDKVSRKEPEKYHDIKQSAVFHVPKFKVKPLVWTPEGSTPVEAEPVKRFQVSKIITFGPSPFSGKENLGSEFVKVAEDHPKFKVHKTTARAWIWQPDNVSDLPIREQSPAMKFEVIETHEPHEDKVDAGGKPYDSGKTGGDDDIDQFGLTPDLIRVLTTEGPQDDDLFLKKKKKIFANSSFYDDPEHKYPTIEEQIKMARQVALSLSAPDNVTARGQRMFMKRKEKADHWTADMPYEDVHPTFTLPRIAGHQRHEDIEQHGDLYYNPMPWKTTPTTRRVEKVVMGSMRDYLEGFPDDPAASSAAFAKNRSLFEGGPKFKPSRGGKKIPGGGTGALTPQACIGLANELKEMKGRGAQLFAKRRAKAIEDEEMQSEGERQIGGGSLGGGGPSRERSEERGYLSADQVDSQPSTSRLNELISISKAYMYPWESTAARQYEPWQTTTTTTMTSEVTEEPWRPKRDEETVPSFLGRPSASTYRPVRFQVPMEIPVTDF